MKKEYIYKNKVFNEEIHWMINGEIRKGVYKGRCPTDDGKELVYVAASDVHENLCVDSSKICLSPEQTLMSAYEYLREWALFGEHRDKPLKEAINDVAKILMDGMHIKGIE